MAAPTRLVVARVRGLHGLRGLVRVEVLTDRPAERFRPGAVLHPEGSARPLTIASAAPVEGVDGVMLGRAAYHDSWVLADPGHERARVVRAMHDYLVENRARGWQVLHAARHMLGLYHGTRRARLWRRMLSDSNQLARNDPALLLEALQAVESPAPIERPPGERP